MFPVLIILCAHSVQLFEYKANDRYHFSNGAYWHFDEVNWARGWARIGNWLQEKYPPTTRIAVITAGAIPFYSRLPAIDLVGLNTRAIARSEFPAASTQYTGHEKANAEYVLQQEPQFIRLFPCSCSAPPLIPKRNWKKWSSTLPRKSCGIILSFSKNTGILRKKHLMESFPTLSCVTKRMSEKRYYTFGRYLRERFGERVHKIAIDAGFT